MDLYSDLLQKAQEALSKNQLHTANQLLKKAESINPTDSFVNHSLGLVASSLGNHSESLVYFGKAVGGTTVTPQMFYNYATVLMTFGFYHEAFEHLKNVLRIDPNHSAALNNCGAVCSILGNITEGEHICRHLLSLDPTRPEVYVNLGLLLTSQCRVYEALDAYETALQIKPEYAVARSNYLLTLCYVCDDPHLLYKHHCLFQKNVPLTVTGNNLKTTLSPTHEKINIGLVSPDFKMHSVAYFLNALIKNYDRNRFRFFCYSDVTRPDSITHSFKSFATGWYDIFNLTDQTVAQLISNDKIDILIDLAGHTANNRMSLFCNKIAPIQVSYLGYPCTTGLSTIDYYITSPEADPLDQDVFFAEKLYRIPDSFLCFTPSGITPDIQPAPHARNGYVTFGCFNNLPKISDTCISLWSEILNAVPSSKLVLKSKSLHEPEVKERFVNRLRKQGMDPTRIVCKHYASSLESHLKEYNEIDIALDTYPYCGTTTTCEALVMGVPVISLVGKHHASRVGFSILSTLGLNSLVAVSMQRYIETAVFLATHTEQVDTLRVALRRHLCFSKLCDSAAYARKMEHAFEDMVRLKK